ncbi:MAG TPA: 2-oxo acid dehydrogenase subunit E2 [Nanoarchaeota archaeon]|nr:2-oxo acid dehydrogenase subunit E2 [Candidatus Woesearchaeota archaeon]HIH14625.1 2-oxo acid dehydrogenase subunit E2 [Nanoarchaeota archaeon]HIH59187.1 2-oxo acid dehydrogenase subunit E2 [Nanoarchaeota archaeon]HII13498.1 2-oxo acid dehydrogenase subunit E2 [Nanoarchaeota archaeon]HIJ05587.1 2-oxo acid dehydrogenase subunit E2 [Nanoarchaeota archaeon]
MATQFKFPDVGEGIHEGHIVSWLVKEEDLVKEDQVLVKVETDKAVVELPSPAAGKILKIYFKAGDIVKVGQVLVDIGSEGEKIKPQKEIPKVLPKKGQSVVGELEEATEEISAPKEKKSKAVSKQIKALPKVRKLAKEMNIDLSTIQGSGKQGEIVESDLKKEPSIQKQIQVTKKYDMYGYVDRIPLQGLRAQIKINMEKQAAIPIVTHMDEIDVTVLGNIREKEKKKYKDIKLTFLPYIIKAVIGSLKENKLLNASLEQDAIVLKKYYNIGIAVATEEGLIVPVVKGAEKKSLLDIAKEIQKLSEQARQRTLDLMDIKGSTFTITNIGSIGGRFATPMLNIGESAILALGKIYEKPLVINGKIQIRKVLPVSIAFDHRILDGAHAALFTNKMKEYLEDPDQLMLELS